ncbi:CRISPR-associated helicase Cas3' [Bacillus sp. JJ864]|uniref:CRISPR-associated helicase Cas3' n=1 Tax=Bacillus sp. JJ864 TaxID=3122975 RepID=UPI003000BC9F
MEIFQQLLAKSESNRSAAETIKEHTEKLLTRHTEFKNVYPEALTERDWEILWHAAYYHDVGKANTKFQNKLRSTEERQYDILPDLVEVPHAYLSCAYIPIKDLMRKFDKNEVRILLLAVYYHHERNEQNTNASKQIIERDLQQYVSLLKSYFTIRDVPAFDYGRFTDKDFLRERNHLYHFVRIKGLLNKLDYAASGGIAIEVTPKHLTEKVEKHFKKEGYGKNELQQYLYENQQDSHVVIASTGIGKTEGALFWLGDDKGIFTLPLKVSINTIYDRIRDVYNYDDVGLLHSDSHLEYVKRAEGQEFSLSALNHTKQFSMPLTVTTLDQIIDFIGLYPGFELKLAIFSYSKLVIDEIQMYSPRLVAFIVMGLKYITDMGGKFLIMTATLPPLFIEALHKENIPFKRPETPFLKLNDNGEVMQRHVKKMIERDLTIEEVLVHSLEQKILIIVNTVGKAQELYKGFENLGIEAYLLHSRFIQKHRQSKEAAIKELGKRTCKETGIWITTQLVEASVDIDFDILLTELSEATGLFQRMGRVYRGRHYNGSDPNVYVFTGETLPSGISATSRKSVVDFTIYEKSKDILMKYDNQLLTESLKMDIIDQIYSREALGGECVYIKEFDTTLQQLKNVLPYEETEKPTLRDIQNVTVIPSNVYRAHEQDLTERCEQVTTKLERENILREYTVAIPEWAYQVAYKKGYVDGSVKLNKYTEYPVVAFQYTEEMGLIYKVDESAHFM